ncbi:hypothetical protein GCM10027443_09660 [Pontibacter brevis]
MPVAANIDPGHTAPMATLPMGGSIRFQEKKEDEVQIKNFTKSRNLKYCHRGLPPVPDTKSQ